MYLQIFVFVTSCNLHVFACNEKYQMKTIRLPRYAMGFLTFSHYVQHCPSSEMRQDLNFTIGGFTIGGGKIRRIFGLVAWRNFQLLLLLPPNTLQCHCRLHNLFCMVSYHEMPNDDQLVCLFCIESIVLFLNYIYNQWFVVVHFVAIFLSFFGDFISSIFVHNEHVIRWFWMPGRKKILIATPRWCMLLMTLLTACSTSHKARRLNHTKLI